MVEFAFRQTKQAPKPPKQHSGKEIEPNPFAMDDDEKLAHAKKLKPVLAQIESGKRLKRLKDRSEAKQPEKKQEHWFSRGAKAAGRGAVAGATAIGRAGVAATIATAKFVAPTVLPVAASVAQTVTEFHTANLAGKLTGALGVPGEFEPSASSSRAQFQDDDEDGPPSKKAKGDDSNTMMYAAGGAVLLALVVLSK